MLCRSFLVTPSLKPEQFTKAREVGADIGFIDLEDSIPLSAKDEARRFIGAHFSGDPIPNYLRGLRINTIRSHIGLRDVVYLIENNIRPDVLMIPKIETAEDIRILDDMLRQHIPNPSYIAIIETAKAVTNLVEIAEASPNVKGLVFGAADYSSELGMPMNWETLYHARAQIALAACRAKVIAIDTPCFELGDLDRLAQETRRVKDLGLTGKAAIHPSQIAVINEVFNPSPAEIEKARRIVAISERNEGRICVLDDMMIGPPLVERAKRVLSMAEKVFETP